MKIKKILKCSLAVALIFGSVGALAGCKNDDSENVANGDKQYEIYELAVNSGYTGTYEQWLATIKGEKGEKGEKGDAPVVTIESDGYWYVDGICTNVKASGDSGLSGKDGSTWLTGTIIPSSTKGKDGDFYFDTLSKKIYNKINGTWTLMSQIVDGVNGSDGRGIANVVKTSDGNIDTYTITYTDNTQYSFNVKNGSDGEKGDDASEVTFRVNNGYIQWAYVGIDEWSNLVNLDTLKGEKGNDGETPLIQINDGIIQWKYGHENLWKDLFDLNTVKGKDGSVWLNGEGVPSINIGKVGDYYFDTSTKDVYVKGRDGWGEPIASIEDGNDGREIVLQTSNGYIQWKYEGEESWQNLASLDSLKGEKGDTGVSVVGVTSSADKWGIKVTLTFTMSDDTTKVSSYNVVDPFRYYAVGNEEDLKTLMEYGVSSVRLIDDIIFETAVVVDKELTIDLNGKTISVPEDLYGDGVFHVIAGGKLTIEGEGIVDGVGNNPYSIGLWADGGEIIINGGTYTNEGAFKEDDFDNDHYDLIYVKNNGKVTINGGTFICATPVWTLNSHNTYKGTIVVKGGIFYNFDPSRANTDDNGVENNPVYYVADGYLVREVVGQTGYFEVYKG